MLTDSAAPRLLQWPRAHENQASACSRLGVGWRCEFLFFLPVPFLLVTDAFIFYRLVLVSTCYQELILFIVFVLCILTCFLYFLVCSPDCVLAGDSVPYTCFFRLIYVLLVDYIISPGNHPFPVPQTGGGSMDVSSPHLPNLCPYPFRVFLFE